MVDALVDADEAEAFARHGQRVATPDATLAEPGVHRGLFGAWGGTVRLPEICGLGDAMDLACSGRVVSTETARRMGLVSRVVEDP